MKLKPKTRYKKEQQRSAEDFINFLLSDLGQKDSKETLIYLLEHNFINSKTINKYIVLKKYYQLNPEYGQKNKAMNIISRLYGISVRYVNKLLCSGLYTFKKNNKYNF